MFTCFASTELLCEHVCVSTVYCRVTQPTGTHVPTERRQARGSRHMYVRASSRARVSHIIRAHSRVYTERRQARGVRNMYVRAFSRARVFLIAHAHMDDTYALK